jgi:hypothetical protein
MESGGYHWKSTSKIKTLLSLKHFTEVQVKAKRYTSSCLHFNLYLQKEAKISDNYKSASNSILAQFYVAFG